jgi:hypothetical protein
VVFSGYSVSSTNKTDRHDISEILLKVALREEFEDTKSESVNRMAPKKDKTTKDDLQNTTQKIKDQVTQTLLKPRGELRCFERVGSSCTTSVSVMLFYLMIC